MRLIESRKHAVDLSHCTQPGGMVFSINHHPLGRPWSIDMHLSAPAGTFFNPSEPGMPKDVRWPLHLQ